MAATDNFPENYAIRREADFALSLKAGFRDLVRLAGGQDRAAKMAGTSQSRISENASGNYPDCTPRVHHVVILEHDARVPVITRIMAEMAGYELVPMGTCSTQDPHTHLARIIKDTGEVAGGLSQALADGGISPQEARTLKREAHEAIEALHNLVAQMNGVIDEGRA